MEHIFLIHSFGRYSRAAHRLISSIRAAAAQLNARCLICEYRYAGDIESLICRHAAHGGATRFYVYGSDAALRAAARVALGFSNVEIGMIPDTRGCSFLRNYPHADFRSLTAQLRGISHPIDLIECNGESFVNAICIRPQNGERAASLAVSCDDGTLLTGSFSFIGIGNGSRIGKQSLFPHADPSDTKLDLTLRRVRTSRNIFQWHSAEDIFRQFRRLLLIPHQPLCIDGDGQQLCALRVSCAVIPHGVRFIVPSVRTRHSSLR